MCLYLQSHSGELQKDLFIQGIAKLGAYVLRDKFQMFPNLLWLCYCIKVGVGGWGSGKV